jgi:thiamine biosynthesis lipoprotein
LVVDDPAALNPATADLRALLDRVDTAASRFRPDSELSRANGYAGRPVPVSRLLVELVDAALAAAADTGGAVDPTLGADLAALGYDRDLRLIASRGPAVAPRASSRRWQDVRLDREVGLLTVPRGSVLDLGATAKAWTADRAARRLSRRYGTAVLVELGGDLAVAGHRPDGWCVTVAERAGETGQLVLLRGGGLATSTTTVRRWQRDGHDLHHLLDPRTGAPTAGPWRTVSVAADSALAANTASTAAIVLGADAAPWLDERGLAARLIAEDGTVTTAGRWPVPAMPVRA